MLVLGPDTPKEKGKLTFITLPTSYSHWVTNEQVTNRRTCDHDEAAPWGYNAPHPNTVYSKVVIHMHTHSHSAEIHIGPTAQNRTKSPKVVETPEKDEPERLGKSPAQSPTTTGTLNPIFNIYMHPFIPLNSFAFMNISQWEVGWKKDIV